ncbi:hypothetical protein DEU36_2955 [Microbacterium sp. AG238]|nr:hypothetical protein DEU36_2955 [Microbacterium sp. AG238]
MLPCDGTHGGEEVEGVAHVLPGLDLRDAQAVLEEGQRLQLGPPCCDGGASVRLGIQPHIAGRLHDVQHTRRQLDATGTGRVEDVIAKRIGDVATHMAAEGIAGKPEPARNAAKGTSSEKVTFHGITVV